jgi:hypothetical protein
VKSASETAEAKIEEMNNEQLIERSHVFAIARIWCWYKHEPARSYQPDLQRGVTGAGAPSFTSDKRHGRESETSVLGLEVVDLDIWALQSFFFLVSRLGLGYRKSHRYRAPLREDLHPFLPQANGSMHNWRELHLVIRRWRLHSRRSSLPRDLVEPCCCCCCCCCSCVAVSSL